MGGRGDPAIGRSFTMSTYDEDEDPITGTNGEIQCQWTELNDPASVPMTWQWLGPEGYVFLSRKEAYELMLGGGQRPPRVPRLTRPRSCELSSPTRQSRLVTRPRASNSSMLTSPSNGSATSSTSGSRRSTCGYGRPGMRRTGEAPAGNRPDVAPDRASWRHPGPSARFIRLKEACGGHGVHLNRPPHSVRLVAWRRTARCLHCAVLRRGCLTPVAAGTSG